MYRLGDLGAHTQLKNFRSLKIVTLNFQGLGFRKLLQSHYIGVSIGSCPRLVHYRLIDILWLFVIPGLWTVHI